MRLGLGTVQFGMDYGLSRSAGRPEPDAVGEILRFAAGRGMCDLDTAPAYGEGEAVLGRALWPGHPFRIVTKTPVGGQGVREAFARSLERLGQGRVHGLLVHRADDLLGPAGGAIFEAVSELKEEGRCAAVGVSVYDAGQIDRVLERYPVDLVQLPLSVLDQRLVRSGHLARLAARGIEIHARSIFLQGLLLMAPEDLPVYFEPIRPHLVHYNEELRAQGLSRLEAAVGFVARIPEVAVMICGVESLDQVVALHGTAASGRELEGAARFALDEPRFLDPSRWRLP